MSLSEMPHSPHLRVKTEGFPGSILTSPLPLYSLHSISPQQTHSLLGTVTALPFTLPALH